MLDIDATDSKDFYNRMYQHDGLYATGSTDHQTFDQRKAEMAPYLDFHGQMLEIGCGKGLMHDIGDNYMGIDISAEALRGNSFCRATAVAEHLPFSDKSFDSLFSYHTLEHVLNPERALREIGRVLKLNGIVFLKPAWNCRSWNNKRLTKRPYTGLSFFDKLEKALIPLRNSLFFRGVFMIPWRMILDMIYILQNRPTRLRYRRLSPTYVFDEYWVPDEDAMVSLDPHQVIWFFKSRGYEVLSHPSFLKRILARAEPVVFRYPCSVN